MKKRFQPHLFAVVFFAVSVAHGQTLFTWSPNPTDSLLSNVSNWSGGTPSFDGGITQLEFGNTVRGLVNIDIPSIEIHSLAFTTGYQPYFFGAQNGTVITIANGITVPASASSTVVFDPDIDFILADHQTWNVDGHLTLRGNVGELYGGEVPATLTKTGAGTLVLEGANTFSGGLDVQTGTIAVSSGSVGTGALYLADNTTLRSTTEAVQLHNDISLGQNVTLDSGDFGDLQLSGAVDLRNAATTIKVAGENPVLFTGSFTAEGPATLTFTSPAGEFGGAAFADVFDAGYITSLTADHAALFFFADLPSESTLTLHATNLGYISAAAAPENENIPAASPAALLLRIPSPATFAGTFGLDTDPDSVLMHNYTEPLDFSQFKHASFRFGSHSDALISGTITPVDLGTKSLYPFGGGSGHLGVLSDLTDAPGKPASILVSNAAGTSPQYILFRGNNSTTGTYTLDGVSAHLAVERAIAVLDSPGALPGGASGKFTFGAGAPAYIGATEAAFADFNTFLSHLAAGGHNASSILGLDSHDAFDAVLEYGVDTDNYNARKVSETIDLRAFNSIYLGTASDAILAGTVYAPSNGILKLTGVDDGLLAIAAPLGSNVSSVEIGFADGTASEEFGDGEIEMAAKQTYSGGTTLYSGTLSLSASSSFDYDTSEILSGPIGTGTLTVERGVAGAALAATDYQSLFYNDIVLNAPLGLGALDSEHNYKLLHLYGDLSGSSGLNIYSNVSLAGNNTYAGGTVLNSGHVFLNSASALGTGHLEVRGGTGSVYSSPSISGYNGLTLTNEIMLNGNFGVGGGDDGIFTIGGNVSLGRPVTLYVTAGKVRISGAIDGMNRITIHSFPSASLWLSGANNTYSGGMEVQSGSLVFENASSLPIAGSLRSINDGSVPAGYIGAAFETDVQASFLDRFNKLGTYGSLGFDSADLENPIVISEPIDLTGFSSSVRLASATAATISGDITPADSAVYRFGNGGGILTVTSDLTGSRALEVSSVANARLTLVLKGTNTYAGGTHVSGSILRFDSAGATPSTGMLTAANYGYVGYTEATGLTPSEFLGKFGSSGSDSFIVGFDSTTPGSPRTINEAISLTSFSTSFNSDTYLGTVTSVTLNGTLAPFSSSLNLTGVLNGSLVVNGIIASGTVNNVVIGTGLSEISGKASVTLNAANTYTGGTDLLSSHLILGHVNALGTGTLRVGANDSRISVNQTSGLTIANAVDTGESNHELTLDGPNNFTLSGTIAGQGYLHKTGSSTVTLSGDNSDLVGRVIIENGKLVFAQNTSAGAGGLNLWSDFGIAEFLGDAPVIGPIYSGNPGSQILLAEDSTLTVNLSNPFANSASVSTGFDGSIAGENASVVYAALSGNKATIQLSGASTYTGGTTINPGVTVIASHDNALGTTGTITVNGGTLSSTPGVTLASTATRPIVFTAGSISGSGTLTFQSSLVITNQLALAPGNSIGKLTLNFDSAAALVLNSGGTYRWELADAAGTAGTGWDLIHVSGNIDLAALGGANGVFNISLHTIGQNGAAGLAANFNPNTSFSWAILTATSLPNFDAAKFNLIADSTTFLNATAGGTFSLSVENNTLLLNFAPVPEPSTWALMITGLAAIVVTTLRQRRRG